MSITNRSTGWALHWLIAVLALTALATGYALTRAGVFSVPLLQVHLAAGATAGLLSLARVLFWLAFGPPPPVFEPAPGLQAALARCAHALLRLVPLLLLASGAGMIVLSGAFDAIVEGRLTGLAVFSELPPTGLHHGAALLLAGLTGLHILAASWHRFRLPATRPVRWP